MTGEERDRGPLPADPSEHTEFGHFFPSFLAPAAPSPPPPPSNPLSLPQNEIKMVPEAEHIAEAVLNLFEDIITAAQSVDDISVKVWGADACRGSVHGRVRLPYHPSRCGGFLLCGQG